MNNQDWSLVKSGEDKPDGAGGKLPEPTIGAPARPQPAGAQPSPRQAPSPAPAEPQAISMCDDSNRVPARGLMLAIPAGVALWAAAIYLFARLI